MPRPDKQRQTFSTSHNTREFNAGVGLLIPTTKFTSSGRRTTKSARDPAVKHTQPLPNLLEPLKKKKRLYLSEAQIASAEHAEGSGSAQSEPRGTPGDDPAYFITGLDEFGAGQWQWDDTAYVGDNGLPIYHPSAIPTPTAGKKSKVSASYAQMFVVP